MFLSGIRLVLPQTAAPPWNGHESGRPVDQACTSPHQESLSFSSLTQIRSLPSLVTPSLLLLNFAQIVGFVKVVKWISLSLMNTLREQTGFLLPISFPSKKADFFPFLWELQVGRFLFVPYSLYDYKMLLTSYPRFPIIYIYRNHLMIISFFCSQGKVLPTNWGIFQLKVVYVLYLYRTRCCWPPVPVF